MALDFGKAVQLGFLFLMVGLVLWCVITVKDWYNNPQDRPTWVLNILNTFSPVSYKILQDMGPYMGSNIAVTSDSSPSANTCLSKCSTTYNCN